jgi:hypothetical protein
MEPRPLLDWLGLLRDTVPQRRHEPYVPQPKRSDPRREPYVPQARRREDERDERTQSELDAGRGALKSIPERAGETVPFAERTFGAPPPQRRLPSPMDVAPPDPMGLRAGAPSLEDALRAYYAQRLRQGG